MNLLSRMALRGRIITIVATVLVMAGGVFSLTRMQVELFPDIDFPLIVLVTLYPQAGPESVLQDVTIPLEDAFRGLDGLDTIRSTSSPGFSLVVAEYEFGIEMDQAAKEVEERLQSISLPAGVQPPRVARINPDEFPILQLSVLQDGVSGSLFDLVTNEVLPEISQVPGVFTAEVPPGSDTGASITRTNGQPSLSITILKEPDANTVAVVDGVMEAIEDLKPGLSSEVEFVTVVNQAPQIEASIESLEREATFGAVLAIVVIFVFLLSVRPTLVMSISIPTSILGGLVIMGWQGMTLNMMTLGGLAIAVGRVVDDSIVVLENIYRHIQPGGDRVWETLAATREVAGPITTSTLTTIAVFLPLAFVGGIIGSFFLPFALTITFALLASLVVSLTVVPVLGSLLIRPGDESPEKVQWLQKVYTPVIRWALGHKLVSIGVALVLFIGSFGLLRFIPQTFLPGSGGDLLTIDLSLPRRGSMETKLVEVMEVEEVLAQLSRDGVVETFQVTIGGGDLFGPGGGGGSNSASFFVLLTEDVDRAETAVMLRQRLEDGDRSVVVTEAQQGGPQSNLLELTLTGDDYSEVSATALRLTEALQEMDGLANVGSDAQDVTDGIMKITRVDGRRAVTISGNITDVNTQGVNRAVTQKVEEVGLGPGVILEKGGVFADINEAFAQLGMAMVFGIILVYLVMVVSMRSLIIPFVIVLSLPLASIGALGALFITQRTLGLPALIGMLMLIGLVVTNAIVLLSFVEQLRAKGMSVYDALIQGGRTRIRPILMTAFTTSFALLPLAVIVSDGGIISAELATVVIGGLMTSTFLTLVVIPAVYSLIRRGGPAPGIAGGSLDEHLEQTLNTDNGANP